MAFARQHTFAREEVLPSYFANVLQDRIGPLSSFRLVMDDAQNVAVLAGTGDDAAVLSIEGRWKFNTAKVRRAGAGAAGIYAVFAVGTENDVRNAPAAFSDFTNYTFDLRIVADGSAPAYSTGVVDVRRRIGRIEWNGTAIVGVVQEVGGSRYGWGTYANMPAASSDLTGMLFEAVDTGGLFRCTGAAWVLAAQRPLLVGTGGALPATVYDGRQVDYRVEAAGTSWHLRYNGGSSQTEKWEVLGASALVNSNVAETVFAALGSPGQDDIAVTPPLAGLYDIEVKALMRISGSNPGVGTYMHVRARQGATVVTDEAKWDAHSPAPQDFAPMVARGRAVLAAGQPVSLNYFRDSGPDVAVSQRFISIRPVRVT